MKFRILLEDNHTPIGVAELDWPPPVEGEDVGLLKVDGELTQCIATRSDMMAAGMWEGEPIVGTVWARPEAS